MGLAQTTPACFSADDTTHILRLAANHRQLLSTSGWTKARSYFSLSITTHAQLPHYFLLSHHHPLFFLQPDRAKGGRAVSSQSRHPRLFCHPSHDPTSSQTTTSTAVHLCVSPLRACRVDGVQAPLAHWPVQGDVSHHHCCFSLAGL